MMQAPTVAARRLKDKENELNEAEERPPPDPFLRRGPQLSSIFLHPPGHGRATTWPKQGIVGELPLSVSGRLHGKPRIPSFCVPCAPWGPRENHGGGHFWRSIGGVKLRFCVNPSPPVPSQADQCRHGLSQAPRKRESTARSPPQLGSLLIVFFYNNTT